MSEINAQNIPQNYFSDCNAINQISTFLSKFPEWRMTRLQSGQFCLAGDIPITLGGQPSTVPVTFLLDKGFPNEPPLCAVKILPNTYIKQNHQNVDLKGFIYMPYLSQWGPFHDIFRLVIEMSSLFSKDPPLFFKETQNPKISYAQKRAPQQNQFNPFMETPTMNNITLATLPLKRIARIVRERIYQEIDLFLKDNIKESSQIMNKKNNLINSREKINQDIQLMANRQTDLNNKLVHTQNLVKSAECFANKVDNGIEGIVEQTDFMSERLLRYITIDRAITDTLSTLRKMADKDKIPATIYTKNLSKLLKVHFKARNAILAIIKIRSN